MAETALKFGPEWLRALTQTNGVTAPATTTAVTKYKLANYRYGREEMLAMFDQSAPMPESLREFQQLAVENTQPPLALVTMTEDEQRVWARSVNSDAVLRLTVGKGAVPGAGPGRGTRGGSVDRGRGRGRGSAYQRGQGGPEDTGDNSQFGAFIRPRPFERSHSLSERDQRWDDRDKKPDRQFQGRPNFDGDGYRKENAPASASASASSVGTPSGAGGTALGNASGASRPTENWRSGHSEEDENWRSKVSAQHPTEKWKSWRNHSKGEEEDATGAASNVVNGPAKKDPSRHWLEDHGSAPAEQLPEWIQDQGDTEKVGSFDAKGAFLDTRDCEEEETWENDMVPALSAQPHPNKKEKPPGETAKQSNDTPVEKPKSPPPAPQSPPRMAEKPLAASPPKLIPPAQPQDKDEHREPGRGNTNDTAKVVSTSPKDDSFAHLAKAAENMMAEWTAEEEKKFVSQSAAGEHNLPEHFYRWLYKDPQGDVQGPFSSTEMMEWFQAGYFTMELMVKRVCDAAFSKLGALIKSWGQVPFAATQQPPPIKALMGAGEQLAAPTSGARMVPLPSHPGLTGLPPNPVSLALQQHYVQEVYRVAAMQQIQNHLKTNESFARLSPVEQNRICLQYYMASHPMSRPAGFGDQVPLMNLLSPVYGLPPHLLGGKDTTQESVWPPQPVTAASLTTPAETRGGSVWDADPSVVAAVPMGVPAPMGAPTPSRNMMETLWRQQMASQSLLAEQMRAKEEEERRLQELQKQARLEEERRLAEERRKEEEEQKKREEEEMQRRKQEEERQQKEEEKRRKEEEMRRHEEMERRNREQELLQLQRLEEERKKLEAERKKEEEAAEEERKRKMEEARKVAEEKKRQKAAAKQAAAAAAAAMASATALAPPVAAAPPPVKKSPSKVSVVDAEEFLAMRQPPKPQQQAPVRTDRPQQLGPVWGGKTNQPAQASSLSLAEIQRMQEEKERSLAAERAQQQRSQQQMAAQQALFLQQQQQQQKAATLTWASRAQAPTTSTAVKSLSEIQQEEAERLDKMRKMQQQQRQQQQQQQRQQESSMLQLSGAWGTTSNNLLKSFNSFQYLDMGGDEEATKGFWDEAVTPSAAAPAPTVAPSKNAGGSSSQASSSGRSSSKNQQSKKAEEQVMKLFEVHAKAAPRDDLTAWCVEVLGGIQSYLDIPTVVAILKDVESPAEVHEYVHNFFGNSLDTKDFVRQFLQRREHQQKNAALSGNVEDDTFSAPILCNDMSACESTASAGDGFTAARSKKKKKNKMQKVDSSLLGFTVQADPTRLNAGEIDRVEGL